MMRLNKSVLRAIHNVFQDCGSEHRHYGEGLQALHEIFQLFNGEEEIDIDRTTDLRPEKYKN